MYRHATTLVLVLLLAAAPACTRGYEEAAGALDPSGGPSPAPSTTPSAAQGPSGSPRPSTVPGTAPIVVRAPFEGDVVRSPLVVSGSALSGSGEVIVRIIGADRSELASTSTPVDCGAECRGRFRVALAFYTAGIQPGAIQVFELGSGGSIDHLVEVPVTLTPGA